MRRQYADIKDFLPGRPAQAKATCLSGTSTDGIAKRLLFLPPQVAIEIVISKNAEGRAV